MPSWPLVGVDIGGTKTRVLVVRDDEGGAASVPDIVVPTASWRPDEREPDGGRLAEVIRGRQSLDEPISLGVGANGRDTREQCEEFAADLRQYVSGSVVVVNDAELLVPAAGLGVGIGLVVGTGSIVVGQDDSGALLTAGGWGWVLGDPGSAPGLVRDAARAVLADRDAGREPDLLGDRLMDAFDVTSLVELGYAMTAAREITDWSVHAHVVFDAADAGSERAAQVVEDSARQLAAAVGQLVRRGAQGNCVVTAGGVITARERLSDAFKRHLADTEPGLQVRVLNRAPVYGAVELARRAIDQANTKLSAG